jgi:CheY-like chemotaxis protein
MSTKVLVFESDATFAETLREGLQGYGCAVSVVDDANQGLQAAASDKPDLILLAIELPKMNGFSVCNKLKRDPALKDIPLIIMSSDSTEETFEQHRRLRTRAEDYVHKPITLDELVARAQSFVTLDAHGAAGALNGSDEALVDDAIVLDDDIEIEEADAEAPGEPDDAPSLEAVRVEAGVDAETDVLAEQAFDALIDEPEIVPSSRLGAPLSQASAPTAESEFGDSPHTLDELDEPELASVDLERAELDDAELAAAELDEPELSDAEISMEEGESALPEPAVSQRGPFSVQASELLEDETTQIVGGPEMAGVMAAAQAESPAPARGIARSEPPLSGGFAHARVPALRASSLPPRAADLGDVGKYREELEKTRARVRDLEDELRRARDRADELEEVNKRGASKDQEVQRLQRELDETKAKLASSGRAAGSAREFLDLREQLNKKDKEILDYKDQLSHKDKELLMLRDNALALEREKADLSDRIVDLERQQQELARANDAFRGDKEQAVKRADDFKRKAEKTKADLDAKLAELAELSAAHQAELAERDEHAAALVAEHQQTLQEAARAQERAVQEAEVRGLAKVEAAREQALREAALEHERALADVRREHEQKQSEALAAREAELKREHDAKLTALHRGGEEALAKLRAEHEQALAEAEVAAERKLSEREAELVTEHEKLLAKEAADHSAALMALVDQKQASEATRDARIAALEAELAARSGERDEARQLLEQQSQRASSLEGELQQRTNERDSAALTLQERDARIAALESELGERTGQRDQLQRELEQRDTRLVQLEAALASSQSDTADLRRDLQQNAEKLARANQKWSDDRASLERAKDALAAALVQIEETESRSFD